MGKKGLFISISVVSLSAVLLFVSFFLCWQDISAAGGAATVNVHLLDINIHIPSLPLPGLFHGFNEKGRLREIRNMACAGRGLLLIVGDICSTLTADYVCGVIFVLVSVIAITLDFIAVCYLGYYATGSTHRAYRKAALNCLVVAPACLAVGLLSYIVALAMGTHGFRSVFALSMLPGSGFYVAFVGTIVLSVVPFLSKTWALYASEALSDERHALKKQHLDNVLFHTNLKSEESSQMIYNKSLKNEHGINLAAKPGSNYHQTTPCAPSEPSSRTNVYCASYSVDPQHHGSASFAPNQGYQAPAPYANQHTTVSYHQTSEMRQQQQPQSTFLYEQQPTQYANAVIENAPCAPSYVSMAGSQSSGHLHPQTHPGVHLAAPYSPRQQQTTRTIVYPQ